MKITKEGMLKLNKKGLSEFSIKVLSYISIFYFSSAIIFNIIKLIFAGLSPLFFVLTLIDCVIFTGGIVAGIFLLKRKKSAAITLIVILGLTLLNYIFIMVEAGRFKLPIGKLLLLIFLIKYFRYFNK